nr:biotin--[acetyl-CoA-carboxylase] ligase [Sphingomonas sp. KC8]
MAATGSTNDDVATLARAGEREGLWLRADTQTGGRGRHGRPWQSPPGNLFASTIVRLRAGDPPPAMLAMVAALALHQVAAAYAGDGRIVLKWPNDLLLDGAKMSGILLESAGDAVVVGFGVNLAHRPEGLDRQTASFAASGLGAPDPAAFLVDLADAFARWLARWRTEGVAGIRREWLARAHVIGTPLRTTGADGDYIEGLFDGLDESGALRLRLADGRVHILHAGDVFLI